MHDTHGFYFPYLTGINACPEYNIPRISYLRCIDDLSAPIAPFFFTKKVRIFGKFAYFFYICELNK